MKRKRTRKRKMNRKTKTTSQRNRCSGAVITLDSMLRDREC